MKKALILGLAVLGLTACGTNTRQEKKVVDGQEFLCTWTESAWNPGGWKKDYRCEAFWQVEP